MESLEGRTLLTAGALDTSFGTAGLVTSAIGPANEYGNATAIDSSGRIVVAGFSNNGTKDNFAVVRYTPSGALDTTFGGTGKVTTSFNSYNNEAYAIAIQPDGKILVGGTAVTKKTTVWTTIPDEDFALARYNSNGTLDTTFGKGGLVTTHFSVPGGFQSFSNINSIVVQSDGRIVVAGRACPVTSGHQSAAFALARYNSNGSLDTSFGSGGTVVTDLNSGADYAVFVGLQTISGATKIVAVGTESVPGTYENVATAIRYNLNGTLDTSFGNGGVALDNTADFVRAGAIQADGSILAVGVEDPSSGVSAMGAERFSPNGALDTTFNGTGHVAVAFGQNSLQNGLAGDDSQAYAVVIQPNGSIVLGGYATTNVTTSAGTQDQFNFALARLTPAGQLDTTFGSDGTGRVITPLGNGVVPSNFDYNNRPNTIGGLALTSSGAIVAAGNDWNGSNLDIAVARYLGDPQATTTTLASSANPLIASQPVTFTATVSAAFGTPTGTVEFWDGTTLLGTGTIVIVNGVATATFTISSLGSGTHDIRAIYDGDSNDQSSSSGALSQVVN